MTPDIFQSITDAVASVVPAKYIVAVWVIATTLAPAAACAAWIARKNIGDDSKAAWVFDQVNAFFSRIGTKIHP